MSYKINTFVATRKAVVSNERRLSICLGTDGFSFAERSSHGELLSLCEVTCDLDGAMATLVGDLRGVLAEANIQPVGYGACELLVPSRLFVWVPEHLYDASRERSYLEALGKVPAGSVIYSSYCEVLKSWMVFAVEQSAVSAFKIAITGLKVHCLHEKLVNETVMEQSAERSLLMMHLRKGATDFAVISNKKLLMSNSYDCANVDEALYHALNITKEFHLEEMPMRVALCGDVDRAVYGRIRPFFPEVVLYAGRPLKLAEPEMQQQPLYRHALILS